MDRKHTEEMFGMGPEDYEWIREMAKRLLLIDAYKDVRCLCGECALPLIEDRVEMAIQFYDATNQVLKDEYQARRLGKTRERIHHRDEIKEEEAEDDGAN